jgi:hypothetical protein
LVEDHKLLAGPISRRGTEDALAKARVAPVVDERPPERLGEVADAAVVLVVAVALAAEQRPQRVVEVVGPLRVRAPAPDLRGPGFSAWTRSVSSATMWVGLES